MTLRVSLRNHLHSELFHIWVNTGYFSPIRLSTINNHFYAHPPSHLRACIALCRKDRYWISITPVITKALFITICTCPSKSDLPLSFLVLSCIQNKPNQQLPRRHQSTDAKAHWLQSCTSLQQTSHDGISLISNVMCSTT